MSTIRVVSDKNPDIEYEMDLEAGTCTCPHYTQKLSRLNAEDGGGRVCKHVQRERQRRHDEKVMTMVAEIAESVAIARKKENQTKSKPDEA